MANIDKAKVHGKKEGAQYQNNQDQGMSWPKMGTSERIKFSHHSAKGINASLIFSSNPLFGDDANSEVLESDNKLNNSNLPIT